MKVIIIENKIKMEHRRCVQTTMEPHRSAASTPLGTKRGESWDGCICVNIMTTITRYTVCITVSQPRAVRRWPQQCMYDKRQCPIPEDEPHVWHLHLQASQFVTSRSAKALPMIPLIVLNETKNRKFGPVLINLDTKSRFGTL